MERRLGIIAGSGEFPLYVVKEAQRQGYSCAVAAIKEEAEPSIESQADVFKWFDVHEIFSLISFFHAQDIKTAVFGGKIDPRTVYRRAKTLQPLIQILAPGKDREPTSILKVVIALMARDGIQIIDPTPFISSAFCKPGILTQSGFSPDMEQDISFGWKAAKIIADLEIGQTVVVKHRAVVAVEGIEGTDEAIKRGGSLAGEGTVVVKVARTRQDARIDLPAVGASTVKSLAAAGSAALCFEADKMPFFQRKEALALASAHKICIIARSEEESRG